MVSISKINFAQFVVSILNGY